MQPKDCCVPVLLFGGRRAEGARVVCPICGQAWIAHIMTEPFPFVRWDPEPAPRELN